MNVASSSFSSTAPTTAATQTPKKQSERSTIQNLYKSIAAVTGSVLEWYDFTILGDFSDVIGKVFFPPNQSRHADIVEAFVAFGGAFLTRPLGGILFGHIGDVYGRKRALELSIFLMAIPTVVMGCLPSYAAVGPWAMVGLALTRLLQGLSVGGQLMSSLVYCCEIQPRQHWGFHGTHPFVGGCAGALLGSLVAALLRHVMSDAALESWGWRVPFWSGWLVALAGLYLQRQNDNSDSDHEERKYAAVHSENRPIPLQLAFARHNLRSLVAATLVSICSSGGFYVLFIWMPVFMTSLLDPPVPHAFVVNSIALFLCMLLMKPYAGHLSDKFGRNRTMTVGGILMIVLSVPIILAIGWNPNMWIALVGQVILGVSFSLWNGPLGAWLVETFEPEARMTSVAIGYNVSQALLGGFSPAIATIVVDQWGNAGPGVYLALLFVISFVGLHCVALPEAGGTKTATRDELLPLQSASDDQGYRQTSAL